MSVYDYMRKQGINPLFMSGDDLATLADKIAFKERNYNTSLNQLPIQPLTRRNIVNTTPIANISLTPAETTQAYDTDNKSIMETLRLDQKGALEKKNATEQVSTQNNKAKRIPLTTVVRNNTVTSDKPLKAWRAVEEPEFMNKLLPYLANQPLNAQPVINTQSVQKPVTDNGSKISITPEQIAALKKEADDLATEEFLKSDKFKKIMENDKPLEKPFIDPIDILVGGGVFGPAKGLVNGLIEGLFTLPIGRNLEDIAKNLALYYEWENEHR